MGPSSSWQIACLCAFQCPYFPPGPFPYTLDWFFISAHRGVMESLGVWMDGGLGGADSPCCTNIYSFQSPKTCRIALRPARWPLTLSAHFPLIFLTPSGFSVQPRLVWLPCFSEIDWCHLGTSASNLTRFNRACEKQLTETHAYVHACNGAGPSAELGSSNNFHGKYTESSFQHMLNSSAKFSFHIDKINKN